MPLLSSVLILVLFVAIIVIVVFQQRTWLRTSREIAGRTGLVQTRIGWRTEKYKGEYSGWPFTIKVRSSRGGARTEVVFSIQNPTHRGFSLAEDPFYRKGESFSGKVFHSGDDKFDSRFVFKTHSDNFARAFLSLGGLRRKLLQLNFVDIELTDHELWYVFNGDIFSFATDQALLILDVMSDLARTVDTFRLQPETEHAKRTTP